MADAGPKGDAPKKPLVEQILEWSEKSLTEWQRDALRRLFVRSTLELTADDYQELFLLMKKENGIVVPGQVAAKPWSREHLPNSAADNDNVTLKAMRDLKYVNRIAEGQGLQFCPKGMTIIYGGNGSGKSGYSRVLKRACRARDQTEPIHPDAMDASLVGKVPEATFEVEFSGKTKSVKWKVGDSPPDDLATIAVFDAKCARAYLTTEGDVAYVPFGLDVVANLATTVLPDIDKMLTWEVSILQTDLGVLEGLKGNTKVGELISSFGVKTDEKALEKLAAVTDADVAKLADLDKTLAEEDPAAAAKKVRLEAQRLSELVERIERACASVGADSVEAVKRIDDDGVTATKAVEAAAEKLQAGEELLPGTGAEVWRLMFDAARRYSTEAAYPGHAFPHTAAGAVCPLCQEELGEAGARLKRFEEFLQQDAAKRAESARNAVTRAQKQFTEAKLGFVVDDALGAEIAALDAKLLDKVQAFEKTVESRRQSIVASLLTHDWKKLGELTPDPRTELRSHADKFKEKATALDSAGDAEKRKSIVSARDELKAQVALKNDLRNVKKLLENIKLKAKLEGCRKDLKTQGISNKAKGFAEEAVSAALRKALEGELERLGGVPVPTKLADRSEKGKTKYRLQIVAAPAAKLEEILSEGEQRAIAIGSFLAELGLAGHKGGIVFDDPVSSLDHQRKTLIAKRLAEEAKIRQVVIFTHDLVFLSLVLEEIDKAKAEHQAHWLEKDGEGYSGKVRLDDSPYTTRTYRDTKLAKLSIEKAKGTGGEERVQMLRHAAGQLRRTLEEVVQQHLFKEVIGRWRENLMITRLRRIDWDNAVADEIDALFGELSRHMEGHSHSEEFTGGAPQVEDLTKLTARVDAVIVSAKKERK